VETGVIWGFQTKKGASLRAVTKDLYAKWRRKPNEQHVSDANTKAKTVHLPSGNARIARFNHLIGLCRSIKATVVTAVSNFLSKSMFTVWHIPASAYVAMIQEYLFFTDDLLFKKMGIVVAPLHLEVWVFISSSSSISDRSGSSFLVLLAMVEAFPPDFMRRRFAPTMAAKGLFAGVAIRPVALNVSIDF
jgi:hypothetical protein